MTSWKSLYKNGLFKIDTNQASELVLKYALSIPKNSRVIDLGCGNGRNSVYLAQLGHSVDAVDMVDLGWISGVSPKIKKQITFKQADIIREFSVENHYGAAILTRLIQYLPQETVKLLFKEITTSLEPNGFIIGSYNTWQTNKHNHHLIKVGAKVYSHKPAFIKQLADGEDLKTVEFEVFKTMSQHVNYDVELEACEFVFKKVKI